LDEIYEFEDFKQMTNKQRLKEMRTKVQNETQNNLYISELIITHIQNDNLDSFSIYEQDS
jgi:hypothetical protein